MMSVADLRRVVVVCLLSIGLAGTGSGVISGEQLRQDEIAQQLRTGSPRERGAAAEMAAALAPADVGPDLRQALFAALARERQIHRDHYWAAQNRPVPPIEAPELVLALVRVVGGLDDPASIPALAAAVGTGFGAINPLVSFGQQAVPAIVGVVTSAEAEPDSVHGGLMALRLIVESAGPDLSAAAMDQVRGAAERVLTSRQRFPTTTWRAIDLAVVTGDPDLRGLVQALAEDAQVVRSTGVEDPELIERTRQIARERLAGVPAMPRPRQR